MDDARHGRLGRLRWHSRRALLELDLVLQRYWLHHGENLNATDEAAMTRLLAFEDHDLWDLVSGREVTDDQELNRMLGLLRQLDAVPAR